MHIVIKRVISFKYIHPVQIDRSCSNNKEILTGLEVNMQFCCPEEWEYSTRRSRVEYSHYEGQQNCIFTENGPVNISIIIFCILKKSR